MTRRVSRNSADRLRVVLGDDAATPTVLTSEAELSEETAPATSGSDPADGETFGLRVVWQSEAELLEAAEFLLATRMQRDESLRVLHEVQSHAAERPGDAVEGDEDRTVT